ncbi:DUF3090 domain-containing protein [Tessaracoccus antarcticus]|uniref:DUF3090 domain-containing protein n=1 Tax=Tessaracoccus antarcticus TaxID=2479848 RepID=A0A3M0GKB5_9ACTN|nr:DUF3090 domain-containing protein [Tessaracoccus antarcticus]RMB57756.1 DUF3090 domain-containing protein [Tessaracoccus antarcticus]
MLLEFPRPDRCVVGTIGEPGNRLFIIQVSQGGALAAVAIEKQQVQVLGRRMGEILDQLESLGHSTSHMIAPSDMGPLDAPLDIEFRVGAIGLAWDAGRSAIQLELFSQDLGEEKEDEDGNVLMQIWLVPRMARDFSLRTQVVVASGRPACPFCAQPIDAGGHICPRSNGYRTDLF